MTQNDCVDWKAQGEASSEGQVADSVKRSILKPAGTPQRLQNDCTPHFCRVRSEKNEGTAAASTAKGRNPIP